MTSYEIKLKWQQEIASLKYMKRSNKNELTEEYIDGAIEAISCCLKDIEKLNEKSGLPDSAKRH